MEFRSEGKSFLGETEKHGTSQVSIGFLFTDSSYVGLELAVVMGQELYNLANLSTCLQEDQMSTCKHLATRAPIIMSLLRKQELLWI